MSAVARQRWRLLLDGPAEGAWNMAVDEALLQHAILHGGVPTLRCYSWEPHSLSLGAHQEAARSVDWEALRRDGCGVVRRPTGGRAILHAKELTYSVTAPLPPGGTLAAYRWIAGGLESGLAGAGVRVDLERTSRPLARGIQTRHPCFAAAGRYELVAEGRKIVGSAQRRRRGWLMQHGSILLGPEHLRLPIYLTEVDVEEETRNLRLLTVDCSELLGRAIDVALFAEQFAGGFENGMDVLLEPGGLDPEERALAEQLCRDQFSDPAWTRDGTRKTLTPRTGG